MKATSLIRKKFNTEHFDIAVLGGSGIEIGKPLKTIDYRDIPDMPIPTVPGHRGILKLIKSSGKNTLFFEGRFHYYEGKTDKEIRFIPRLCSELGVKLFIVTCSSGAVSKRAADTDIGIIIDHVNLSGRNPLVGLTEEYGKRVFVNMKNCYDPILSKKLLDLGKDLNLKVEPVVLAGVLGPNYETFSEVKALERLGIDTVSMSTVVDVISAKFYDLKTVGLTIIANDARKPLVSHEEVLRAANMKSSYLNSLISTFIEKVNLE